MTYEDCMVIITYYCNKIFNQYVCHINFYFLYLMTMDVELYR